MNGGPAAENDGPRSAIFILVIPMAPHIPPIALISRFLEGKLE